MAMGNIQTSLIQELSNIDTTGLEGAEEQHAHPEVLMGRELDDQAANSSQVDRTADLGALSCLPRELIMEILSLATTASDSCITNHRSPGRLMAVCRHFRQMVHTTPGCWTTVVLSPSNGYEHLPRYLERSGTRSISVWLYIYPFKWDGTSWSSCRPVVEAQDRWRSVVIASSARAGYPHNLIPPNLPQLEEIHVRDQGAGISVTSICPAYPKLRILRAAGVTLALDKPATTIALEELEFKLQQVTSIGEISSFLRLNPRLRRLQIETSIQPPVGETLWMGVAEVVLPQMESISFLCQSIEPVKALVYVIYAPNVSCVAFTHYALESPVEDYVSILRFCIKRFPQLARIAFKGLIGPEWTPSILDGLSPHLPEGRSMTVTIENMGDFILQGSTSGEVSM